VAVRAVHTRCDEHILRNPRRAIRLQSGEALILKFPDDAVGGGVEGGRAQSGKGGLVVEARGVENSARSCAPARGRRMRPSPEAPQSSR